MCHEVYDKYWQKDWAKVIELTSEAITLYPDIPWAYSMRGYAYAKEGQHDMALDDLTMALELDPSYGAAYFNRGIVYAGLEQYDKAIEDYSKAIEIDPYDILAYGNRARVLITRGRFEEAGMDFKKVLEIEPEFADAMVAIAEIEAIFEDAGESCRWLKKAVGTGYKEFDYIKTNKAFDNIRSAPCYKEIISGVQ